MNKKVLAVRLICGVIYALICFAGGCAVTAWLFHNPLSPAAYMYFAVASCAIGAAAAVCIVEEKS